MHSKLVNKDNSLSAIFNLLPAECISVNAVLKSKQFMIVQVETIKEKLLSSLICED